jgi:sugar porter (SP) family MFS transporter
LRNTADLFYRVNYGVETHIKPSTKQWQIPIGLQLVPGGLLGLGMLLVKESVRWLVKKGRNEEALESLIWVRGGDSPEVQTEFAEIQAGLEEEIRATEGVTWKELLLPANRFRVFIVITMQLGVQLTGNTSLAYYAPQIFAAVGAGTSSLFVTGFFGVVKVVAVSTFCLLVVGRIGRKTAFIGGAAAMGTFMLIIAIIVAKDPPTSHITGPAIAAIIMVYCEAAAYNLSWGPVSWLYLGEIFPTRIRELGIAIGAAAQWLFNFMLSQITPHAVNNLGWKTFLMFAIFNYALVVYSFFVLREVRFVMSNTRGTLANSFENRLQANLSKRWNKCLAQRKLRLILKAFVQRGNNTGPARTMTDVTSSMLIHEACLRIEDDPVTQSHNARSEYQLYKILITQCETLYNNCPNIRHILQM